MTSEPYGSGSANGTAVPDSQEEALAHVGDLISEGRSVDDALRDATALYPAQASLLADYILLTIGLADRPVDDSVPDALASLVVAKALERAPRRDTLPSLKLSLNAIGLSREALCRRLHIGLSLLMKLERGLILVDSLPRRFVVELAAALLATEEAVTRCVGGPPRRTPASEYNAPKAPRTGRPQSFADAIAASIDAGDLPDSERDYWLEEQQA